MVLSEAQRGASFHRASISTEFHAAAATAGVNRRLVSRTSNSQRSEPLHPVIMVLTAPAKSWSAWRIRYDTVRPHSFLRYRPPGRRPFKAASPAVAPRCTKIEAKAAKGQVRQSWTRWTKMGRVYQLRFDPAI